MRRSKQVIAMMVVATALCADRAVTAAAPAASRVSSPSLAARIATSFRQPIQTIRLQPARTDGSVARFELPIREAASGVRESVSSNQFPLPPPAR